MVIVFFTWLAAFRARKLGDVFDEGIVCYQQFYLLGCYLFLTWFLMFIKAHLRIIYSSIVPICRLIQSINVHLRIRAYLGTCE